MPSETPLMAPQERCLGHVLDLQTPLGAEAEVSPPAFASRLPA